MFGNKPSSATIKECGDCGLFVFSDRWDGTLFFGEIEDLLDHLAISDADNFGRLKIVDQKVLAVVEYQRQKTEQMLIRQRKQQIVKQELLLDSVEELILECV